MIAKLRESEYRLTPQRVELIRLIAASEGHPSASHLYNQIKVQFLKAGDTGTSLNKAILSKDNPLADVYYGVDNTFLSRALAEGIFEAYSSPLLEEIPSDLDGKKVRICAKCGDAINVG